MVSNGFSKLYWGFLFVMLDFRIQGFDILPDLIGYLFFMAGFSVLAAHSGYFKKAGNFNILMIVLSLFSLYEKPAQGGGIQMGPFGLFGVLLSIAVFVIGLLVVYHLFMGIKEMAERQEKMDIYYEAEKRWNNYLILQVIAVFALILIFIPILFVVYVIGLLIATVSMCVIIMKFIKRCEEELYE